MDRSVWYKCRFPWQWPVSDKSICKFLNYLRNEGFEAFVIKTTLFPLQVRGMWPKDMLALARLKALSLFLWALVKGKIIPIWAWWFERTEISFPLFFVWKSENGFTSSRIYSSGSKNLPSDISTWPSIVAYEFDKSIWSRPATSPPL